MKQKRAIISSKVPLLAQPPAANICGTSVERPMNKRKMELSDKEYVELAEKLDAEQLILDETKIINNQYENLLKNRIILI